MRSLLLGVGLSAMLAFGCSSSGDGGTASVSSDQACADYAGAVCDKLGSCIGPYIKATWGDADTCKSRFKAQCLTTLAAPSTSTTAASVEDCANAAKGASCNDLLDHKLPDACNPKPGGLADGKACGDDGQCTSGFCGFDDKKKVCGVCGPKPAAAATCADGAKCGPGLTCSKSGKCAATVAIGASCSDDIPCTTGSTCVSGTCAKNLGEGATCDDKATTTAACDAFQSLFCVNKKCQKVTFADVGAACGFELDSTKMMIVSATLCAKSGECKGLDPAKGVFTGTCGAPAADGAACGDTNGSCLPPAICVDSVCKLPDPAACK